MTIKEDIEKFLLDFHAKSKVFDISFSNERGKNIQCLLDLELSIKERRRYLEALTYHDYSEGPKNDKQHGIANLWVFGKKIKGEVVYIKISMGRFNSETLCISFHVAERKMSFPYKN